MSTNLTYTAEKMFDLHHSNGWVGLGWVDLHLDSLGGGFKCFLFLTLESTIVPDFKRRNMFWEGANNII